MDESTIQRIRRGTFGDSRPTIPARNTCEENAVRHLETHTPDALLQERTRRDIGDVFAGYFEDVPAVRS
jgi:hypothetical protein